MRAAFELSHRRLNPQYARAFHLTALDPGPNISTSAAAALFDTTEEHTTRVLRELARRHLLDIDGERWSMHDLLRLYTTEQAPTDDGPAIVRLLRRYCGHVRAAVPLLGGPAIAPPRFETVRQAMAWLDEKRDNLFAVAARADALGHPAIAVELAACLGMYLIRSRRVDAWITLAGHGLAAARQLDARAAQQNMHAELGLALRHARRFPEALEHQQRALGARNLGDLRAQALNRGNIAIIRRRRGELAEAEAAYASIVRIFEELGETHQLATTWNNIGVVQRDLGRFTEAVHSHRKARDLLREEGDVRSEAYALDNLGIALGELHRPDEAENAHIEARTLFLAMDDLEGQPRS